MLFVGAPEPRPTPQDLRAARRALDILIRQYHVTPEGEAALSEDEGLERIKWPIETTADFKWVKHRECAPLVRRAHKALN